MTGFWTDGNRISTALSPGVVRTTLPIRDGHHSYPIFFRHQLRKYGGLGRQWSSRWATRGWTLQEELLSKRLLCYTTGEMIWHCHKGTTTEPAEEPEGSRRTLFSALKDLPPQSARPEDCTDSKAATYTAWYRLVEEYTDRHLTFDKDRLPAIGALAKSFHALLGDQYCAGLWSGDLLFALLWGIHSESDDPGIPGSPVLRALLRIEGHQDNHATEKPAKKAQVGIPCERRGPSWSWVGADSVVQIRWPKQLGSFTYSARTVSVEARGKLYDDFGYIEGGELILDAPYRHLHLRLGSYLGTLWSPLSLVQRVLTRFGPLASTKKLAQVVLTRPDFLASTHTSRSSAISRSSTDFTLIQLAKTNHGPRPVLYLLILQLQTTDGNNRREPQRYRRVGLLELKPWAYDNETDIAEEMTSRLESAAYSEVTKEEWPIGTFIID